MTEDLNQETVIQDALTTPTRSPNSSRSAWKRAVEFVEGSGPEFSSEVNTVLSQRLKVASMILFCAFGAFFLKNILTGYRPFGEHNSLIHAAHLAAHFLAMFVSGTVAWRMCTNCSHVNRHLRFTELMVFGTAMLMFLTVTFGIVLNTASQGFLYPVETPWFLLMFTYALLIPNSWQRALAIMTPMALAPVLVMGLTALFNPTVKEVMFSSQYRGVLLQTGMASTLGLVIATWGVRTIRSLRTAAFEARQMGHYHLKRLLGRGGMGEVHLAEHTLLKRPCAIKLIRPEMAGNPETLKRFEREVRATAQLTHWNTIEIYDYGMAADGTFYYVMEYLPGLNLDQIVDGHGPMPTSRTIHLLKQACDALGEAHDKGLVHRDIKPANIFAAKRGGTYDVVKLLDFGLVRTNDDEVDVKLTQEGKITGSPLYMSPEQASGDIADARSDIYAMGCVAFYLLTGRPPFQETKPVKLILAHIQKQPPSLRSIKEDIPEEIEQIVLKCLEKNPDDRFQSVDDLRAALVGLKENNQWKRADATHWWECHGCPKKRRLDECILEGRELPTDDEFESSAYEKTGLLIDA